MKLTRKGFTLIEMLIVIVIIGILAAALIPRLTGIQARARDTGRKADMNQIASALQSYQLDYTTFPMANAGKVGESLTGGNAGNGRWIAYNTGTASNDGYLASRLAPTYMNTLPKESGKGNMPYLYASTNTAAGFVLASLSEGGGSASNWSGGTNSTSETLAVTLSPSLSGSTISQAAQAIADCLSEAYGGDAAEGQCRGSAKKGQSRYLVAQ